MELNEGMRDKVQKTIERMQKAIDYNDKDYMSELVHHLAEVSYFEGFKDGEASEGIREKEQIVNSDTNLVFTKDGLEQEIATLLLEFGVPVHIKGHRYLTDAILLVCQEQDFSTQPGITKVVYPEIAKRNNTTASRVERAIRHAIEVAWSRGNMECIRTILGFIVNQNIPKPTNSEYIYLITDYMDKVPVTPRILSNLWSTKNKNKYSSIAPYSGANSNRGVFLFKHIDCIGER